MNDTGKIFERLIHLSRVRGLHVKFCPLKCSYGRLKGDRVAIANDRSLNEMNFTLAHELLSGKLNDALSGRLFYADFGSHGGNSHFKNGCFCELFS